MSENFQQLPLDTYISRETGSTCCIAITGNLTDK